MSFENYEGEAIHNFGENLTIEERSARKAAQEKADGEAAEFLVEQRKKREAVDFAERQRAISRAAGLLKAQAVEVCMQVNPNFDETDAKYLYEHKLKDLIAIRRFEEAFFGSSDKQRELFSDVHL